MLNKNDPLVSAVQEVMKRNQAEREAARLVNEKFGIHDRKALPRERLGEWDSAYQAVLTEGISVEKVPMPKTQPETSVQGGQGIQGYDKQSKSAGPVRPHGDNPKVNMEEESKVKTPVKKTPSDYVPGTSYYGYAMLKAGKKAAQKKKIEEEAKELDEKVKMTKQQFANLDGDPKFTANDLAHARKGTHVKKAAAGNLKEAIMNKVMKKLEEKAVSQVQQQAAGAALAAKRGDIPMSSLKGSSKEMMSMSTKELEKFARTKHKGLPEKVDEGFNNRHGLSVTASAEKQAVADQLTERVGNPLLLNRARARARLGDSGVRRPISGTNNLQTRLANMRRSAPALDPNRNIALDNPTTQSNLAIAQRQQERRQSMANTARQNRAGTNTFVAAAKAEAQRRRQAGEPVLKAADVPGVNARDAQSKSDEVMAASRMANRNDLARKARDLRAGTNTFAPKPPAVSPSKTPEERAQQARDAIAKLNDRKAPVSTPPVTTAATTAATTTPPVTTAATTTPPVTTAATTTTPAAAPVPASAPAQAPVRQVAPEAPRKRTAFQDMMRRAQSKSEPAGPRKDAQGLNVHSMTRPQPGKPGVRK